MFVFVGVLDASFLCLVISSPFIDGHFLEPKEILAGLWYEGCRPGVGWTYMAINM